MSSDDDRESTIATLRDLWRDISDRPAEWSHDHLAEVENMAAALKGCAATERLRRALSPRGKAQP